MNKKSNLNHYIFYLGARRREMIPHGLQNFLELCADNLRRLTFSVLGDDAKQHVPFLGTLFIYIFVMNIFGLIPFMKSPSSSLSISIGMALCVFARVQYFNIKNMGLFGYIYHMCGSPRNTLGWLIAPLMLPIEVITQVSRPITLALRLTGNVMGEHALISIFALFAIVIFSFEQLPFGLPIQLPAMLFGLLTSLMQALVFTLLSAVYILLSTPHKSENH
jgi:F-type H+-transporting ATPase subunit a